MMEKAEATEKIVETLKKKSKSKSKFYLKDFYAIFPDEKPRVVKADGDISETFSQDGPT